MRISDWSSDVCSSDLADPELAQVGLTERDAQERGIAAGVVRFAFAENDRARTDRDAAGLIKVVADRRGRVLGASIAGPSAGEPIGRASCRERVCQDV